jgi:quercetin 2,3-dioxygenase
MGNKGIISPGDVQWMTAGSGIIHQEMPKGEKNSLLWGFQLWANLPASNKMMEPRYRDVKNVQIPEVSWDDSTKIKVICGEVAGVRGPVQDIVIDPEYLDVTIVPKATFTRVIPDGYRVFAYVITGSGYFEPERDPYGYEVQGSNYFDFKRDCLIDPENLVIFKDTGDLNILAGDAGVRFLLISGKPIREPVAWYGPIVMNTTEELRTAFAEYQAGTFIKHGRT